MRYDNLLLFGSVYRKKAPSDWEMNGNSGTSYHVILDCFESVVGIDSDTTLTIKVSKELFETLNVGKKYAFRCTADINGSNSSFMVREAFNPIDASDRFVLVPDSSYPAGKKAASSKE